MRNKALISSTSGRSKAEVKLSGTETLNLVKLEKWLVKTVNKKVDKLDELVESNYVVPSYLRTITPEMMRTGASITILHRVLEFIRSESSKNEPPIFDEKPKLIKKSYLVKFNYRGNVELDDVDIEINEDTTGREIMKLIDIAISDELGIRRNVISIIDVTMLK